MKKKQKHHNDEPPVPGSHYMDVSEELIRTHFPNPTTDLLFELSDEEKIAIIEQHFREIMKTLGMDLSDESIAHTPHRVAKMYVKEVFSGLQPKNFPSISIVNDQETAQRRSSMVFVSVSFISFCEHHFVPMQGKAFVAYKPSGKLIGLSKVSRIVRYYAQRPQLQERLTAQIADCLMHLMDIEDVAVSMTATHFCVHARGVHDQESKTTTNNLRGAFEKDVELRREFFEAVTNSWK